MCCDLCHVVLLFRVLVGHPRPFHRGGHVCTVDVLPGPVCCRVQDGSAVRAPTRACTRLAAVVWLSRGLVLDLRTRPSSIELSSHRWIEVDWSTLLRRVVCCTCSRLHAAFQQSDIFRTLLMSSVVKMSCSVLDVSTNREMRFLQRKPRTVLAPTTFCSGPSSPKACHLSSDVHTRPVHLGGGPSHCSSPSIRL